ncbi:MAG: ribosome small subunit-dependent GTPase A [Aerococcaceae bacterium]|nr:ribosome small subunit-dependent GTPase A [Aerococcaceae bacterium]
MTKKGIIYQAISGFYYVWCEGVSYVTKPRGNFRHLSVKPLVGDQVLFEMDTTEVSEGRIIDVLPRRNQLIRPAVANVETAFVVMSLVEPTFSYQLLDIFLVSVELYAIRPIIVLTKYDLCPNPDQKVAEIRAVYERVGYSVVVIQDEQLQDIIAHIKTGIHVVMGQSGVGKSTLLNKLLPQADIETGEISDYLNRGKHTTREVTLYRLNDGLLADTPGFSALEFDDVEKDALAQYFPEIWQASEQCKFRSCLHQQEPHCYVKQCVATGQIAESRYANYCMLFEKIDQRKPIYNRKKKG